MPQKKISECIDLSKSAGEFCPMLNRILWRHVFLGGFCNFMGPVPHLDSGRSGF